MSFTPDQRNIARGLAARVIGYFPVRKWPSDFPASDSSDLDGMYINEHFVGKSWDQITDKELGWTGQDSWSFREDALAFFLPAWLVSYLEEHYPGAENFGLMYFPSWVARLSPFRGYGYAVEQTEALRDIAKFNFLLCGDELEYCQEHVRALELLENEL